MKRKTARHIILFIDATLTLFFLPILIPMIMLEWISQVYFSTTNYMDTRLYWRLQGESTDVNVRLDKLIKSKGEYE